MSCLFGLGSLLLLKVAKIGLLELFFDHILHEPIDNATLFVEILVKSPASYIYITESLSSISIYKPSLNSLPWTWEKEHLTFQMHHIEILIISSLVDSNQCWSRDGIRGGAHLSTKSDRGRAAITWERALKILIFFCVHIHVIFSTPHRACKCEPEVENHDQTEQTSQWHHQRKCVVLHCVSLWATTENWREHQREQ